MNIIVTTYPFGCHDISPIKKLKESFKNDNIYFNKKGSKYSTDELHEILIKNKPDLIIAGTENYGETELNLVPNLKAISRVGIGIDNIDLKECKKRGVKVFNTPSAPTNAVAELTICQILNMLRKIQNVSNDMLEREKWNRYIGRELRSCSVGVIGCGRVGLRIIDMLSVFSVREIFIFDIVPSKMFSKINVIPTSMDNLLKKSDVITIHVPLKDEIVNNKNFITLKDLNSMKPNVRLLNMSRGGIINEEDVIKWLSNHPKATYAVDTFINEPYSDKLLKLGNAYPTPHLGSCTIKSRNQMENGAVDNLINFISKE